MKPAILLLAATIQGLGQPGQDLPKEDLPKEDLPNYDVALIKPNLDGDARFGFRIEPDGRLPSPESLCRGR